LLTRKLRRGIALSLVLAFVVMTAIALYGDVPRMLTALVHFHWQYLPLILGLTLFNYGCRFGKWQYYLHRLQISVAPGKSLLIFLSGLSMAITPGKVGELLKSYQLKQATGVPISRTAPIIVCERLTDGIAMIGLAATGLVLYHLGWETLLVLLILGLSGIALIQKRSLALGLMKRSERLPGLARIAQSMYSFYESAYTLLQWRPLLLAICIGLISWSGECGALYFVYRGLGVAASSDLFIKSLFILAVSSLIGSASGLPGGLGTADGSMLGLTQLLISRSTTLGGAATLLIRLCTLWFGLLIGVSSLLFFRSIQRVDVSVEPESAWKTLSGDEPKISYAKNAQDSSIGVNISTTGEKFL
jgi:glycosyltransferase 2 family protein